ncbi:sodium bicarbonate cotransporter 3-like isoform X1 [Pecten maximus]|uniref:sodium bicarbonate cotransporter 3-like isoform X1 n=2 Tax=Pecten maximus TaxID=6579 RepID=UPI001458498C|nr:sodium bicarbonate cotransporter 3-like isoform X1 [Pecten maximus]
MPHRTAAQKIAQKNMENGSGYDRGRRGSTYIQVRMPNRPDRPYIDTEDSSDNSKEDYDPTDRIQNLLNSVKDEAHKTHSIFSELDVLRRYNDAYEWREAARWVKYEENVEEGGKRWSKPHVASLSMKSLFDLRGAIAEGAVILDLDSYSISEIVDNVLDCWIDAGHLDSKMRVHVRNVSLKEHKHRHTKRPKNSRSVSKNLGEIGDDPEYGGSAAYLNSGASFASIDSVSGIPTSNSAGDIQNEADNPSSSYYKPNTNFMRKIPKDAEVASVMIGEIDDLDSRIVAFVRLKEPRNLGDLCEIAKPVRFLFFCFGPKGSETDCMEIGRCISTMLVDDIFREVAYKSRDDEDFKAGIDEFMNQVTVLPPGEWDPKIRIEPPNKVPSQEFRRASVHNVASGVLDQKSESSEDDHGGHDDPALELSKIPFKGLYDDIKRKIPWYWSDYKDAIHIQCLASFVYVFLGTLTPNVTFGGLLGEATDQYMGVMECIFAAAVTGILFALFGGQPLNILGSTGPMLVLESIIYNLCKDNDWEFMPVRFWVGMWTVFIIMVIVTFNLSAWVKYITRFTEDSFATLIAIIFIVEAFKKVGDIGKENPVNLNPHDPIPTECTCIPRNCTGIWDANNTATNMTTTTLGYTCDDVSNFTDSMWGTMSVMACESYGGTPVGPGCNPPHYVSDVFFFSILLFIGTFSTAVALVEFKSSTLFPAVVRQRISDFAVLIAIVVMVLIDYFIGIETPKLTVPDEFKPTKPGRGWVVNPFSERNPWWLYIATVVPAILSTILIFLDQQITAVIVNRKENKLKKGVGYHLDMFVVAIVVGIHSVLGLPWYVAATVSALAHINSLKKESECTAPGEKPTFLGIREQRVTALFIGILSGLAVLITPVLKMIPMPVLYGVFLYMGFSALRGMQFVDRLFLFFQPVKYQPDLPYIRHVPLWRIHMFTIIQILCLVILWVVKTIKAISIGFPLLVLATGVVRKLLECVYTQNELRYIDDLLPGVKDKGKDKEKHSVPYKSFDGNGSSGKNGVKNGDSLSKPSFFLSEECELNKRSGGNSKNTKL